MRAKGPKRNCRCPQLKKISAAWDKRLWGFYQLNFPFPPENVLNLEDLPLDTSGLAMFVQPNDCIFQSKDGYEYRTGLIGGKRFKQRIRVAPL